MKGRTEKGIKHGIDQIKALRDKLKIEISKSLPTKFKMKFQAIVLSPPNTQLPKTILDENTKDFTIKPVQYHQKAELFDYISQEITLTAPRLEPKPISFPRTDSLTEEILTKYALPKRNDDNFCAANKEKASNKDGIYINYSLPAEECYAALAIDNTKMQIGLKEPQSEFADSIKNDLDKVGLKPNQHFKIEKIIQK